MKIVIDDKIPFIHEGAEQLADEVVYMPGSEITAKDVHDADALIVRTRTHCNRQLLQDSQVRFVATATIGFDHLDTDYLDEAGIRWTNCPGCNATSVGQYVRNALLEAERAGLIRLSESTLGIIGYGHVGKAVYEAVRPYVKQVLLNDPPLFETQTAKGEKEAELHRPLTTLLETCDILTLHTPLTTDGPHPTHHLIGQEAFRQMKRQPLLINAARGGVVDEQALLEALNDGRVRQAIIDTWEGEPNISPELLQQVFIATPHIAGYSADGKANATRMALEALAQWMGTPRHFHIVPPEAEPQRTGLNYSPLADSMALKSAPEKFEYLRGHYPLRRE